MFIVVLSTPFISHESRKIPFGIFGGFKKKLAFPSVAEKNRVQEWLHRLERSVARSFAALLREVPMGGWKLR